MMQHQVAVQARFNPETLERVLRVVRHRGFQICSMNMETATDAQNISIELTVASPRPVDLLFSQLSKTGRRCPCCHLPEHNHITTNPRLSVTGRKNDDKKS
ncbi:Acetolactate synthase small subunit [Enterobacter hormaechei]|nr:Acetolactate synthase small subunit [Enterobacter hormaechei]